MFFVLRYYETKQYHLFNHLVRQPVPLVRVRGIMPIISSCQPVPLVRGSWNSSYHFELSTSAIGSGSWNNAYHFELSTSAIGSWVRGFVE